MNTSEQVCVTKDCVPKCLISDFKCEWDNFDFTNEDIETADYVLSCLSELSDDTFSSSELFSAESFDIFYDASPYIKFASAGEVSTDLSFDFFTDVLSPSFNEPTLDASFNGFDGPVLGVHLDELNEQPEFDVSTDSINDASLDLSFDSIGEISYDNDDTWSVPSIEGCNNLQNAIEFVTSDRHYNRPLGKWLDHQRLKKKKGLLPQERQRLLQVLVDQGLLAWEVGKK